MPTIAILPDDIRRFIEKSFRETQSLYAVVIIRSPTHYISFVVGAEGQVFPPPEKDPVLYDILEAQGVLRGEFDTFFRAMVTLGKNNMLQDPHNKCAVLPFGYPEKPFLFSPSLN